MEFKGEPDSRNLMSEKGYGVSWEIIESYFKNNHLERLVRHQLESYNYFITYEIQKTIQMFR